MSDKIKITEDDVEHAKIELTKLVSFINNAQEAKYIKNFGEGSIDKKFEELVLIVEDILQLEHDIAEKYITIFDDIVAEFGTVDSDIASDLV